MKRAKKLIVALVLALTFIATNLAAAPATVQAAGTLRFAKSATLAKGDDVGYGIINSVKSDKILNLKSSNTKVLTVKKSPFMDDYTIQMKAKKPGTSVISFKVKRKNGKVYSFKCQIRVIKYTNPFSKYTFGNKNYTKQFDKSRFAKIDSKSRKKGKINVTVKKGFKLIGLYWCEYGTGKSKKIKNGSTITLDSMHYLQATYKSTSMNYSYVTYLNGV